MKSELIAIVNRIPYGKVCSYGYIALLLNQQTNLDTSGRIVGRLLSSMPQHERDLLPRRRVLGKKGHIDALKLGQKGLLQISLLSLEGINAIDDYVDMTVHSMDNLLD